MISKRILISTIFTVYLVQFIACQGPTDTKSAAPKTGMKPKGSSISTHGAIKSVIRTTHPMEPGMDPDDDTSAEQLKSNGLRHKLIKPMKSIFWPIRFFWRKIKNLKNKIQQNYNKKQPHLQKQNLMMSNYVE